MEQTRSVAASNIDVLLCLARHVHDTVSGLQVAIETCSFSKYAGFTGVRLGWTVVPEALKFADGSPVINDFTRIMTTCFNAASIISQKGGIACLSDEVREHYSAEQC